MRIKEVTREEFFKYVETIDDRPDVQLSVSDWGEIAKDEHGMVVLSLLEVQSWHNSRYFIRLEPQGYHHFYLVRPLDDLETWTFNGLPDTRWYYFLSDGNTGDPKEPWPSEYHCQLYGEHISNRRTTILEGSGFDEDRPFEDLAKVMTDLTLVYRLLGLSTVKYRTLELRLVINGYSDFIWKTTDGEILGHPLKEGTQVVIEGVPATVRYEMREYGGGHGEGRWKARTVLLICNETLKELPTHDRIITATLAMDSAVR